METWDSVSDFGNGNQLGRTEIKLRGILKNMVICGMMKTC